jgi:hypothetical protein
MTTITDRFTGLKSGLAVKAPVKAATTTNITLSGEQTIDGVSIVSGNRVLVKDQTTGSENGIYVADTSSWSRAADFNGTGDAIQGTLILVAQGTVASGFLYKVTTASFTIGTDSIAFSALASAALDAYTTEISSLYSNISAIQGVYANIDDVTAVNANEANINTVATNVTDIQNAEENANIAKAAGGFTYTYSTTTTATDPTSGKLQLNNADLSLATALYISETTGLSQAIASELATWDDSTSTIHAKLRLFKQSDPSVFIIYDVTGTLTDNGTWDTLTVAYVAGATSLTNNDVLTIQPIRTGDKGDTGAEGSIPTADGAGTVDAITADFTPDQVLADNIIIAVVSTGVNTVTNPTLNIDGTGALTIKARGNAALVAGDTGAAGYTMILRYEATGTYWELLNPATSASLAIAQSFTAAQRASQTTLTSSSASIAVDFALNNDFTHTLTENTTLANPSNIVVGQSGAIYFTQHASAPKTLAYGSYYKFAGGTVPTLTATNSALDTLYYSVRSATEIECSLVKGFA